LHKIISYVIKKGARPDILGIVTSTWEESCFDSWRGKGCVAVHICSHSTESTTTMWLF